MTEIYLYFMFAHYGLYGNAPVLSCLCCLLQEWPLSDPHELVKQQHATRALQQRQRTWTAANLHAVYGVVSLNVKFVPFETRTVEDQALDGAGILPAALRVIFESITGNLEAMHD